MLRTLQFDQRKRFHHLTLSQFTLPPSNEKTPERQDSHFSRQVPMVLGEWQMPFCSGSCNLPQGRNCSSHSPLLPPPKPTTSQVHTILKSTHITPPTSHPLSQPTRHARQDACCHSNAQPTRWPHPFQPRPRPRHQWSPLAAPDGCVDRAVGPATLSVRPAPSSLGAGAGGAGASA